MSVYVETSAAAKLLVEEPESAVLADHVDDLSVEGVRLFSSQLVETELRRLAVREDLDQSSVTELLDRLDLVDLPRSLLYEAGLLPGKHLRSLDALHLAAALRVEAESMLSYDVRQIAAAQAVGVRVVTPI